MKKIGVKKSRCCEDRVRLWVGGRGLCLSHREASALSKSLHWAVIRAQVEAHEREWRRRVGKVTRSAAR